MDPTSTWPNVREDADHKGELAKKNANHTQALAIVFAIEALRLELRAAVDRIVDHDESTRPA